MDYNHQYCQYIINIIIIIINSNLNLLVYLTKRKIQILGGSIILYILLNDLLQDSYKNRL